MKKELYKHYRNNKIYELLFVPQWSGNNQVGDTFFVVYRDIETLKVFVRPHIEFFGLTEEGVQRFTEVSDAPLMIRI